MYRRKAEYKRKKLLTENSNCDIIINVPQESGTKEKRKNKKRTLATE